MNGEAHGTFEVAITPAAPPAEGVAAAAIAKTFSGDLAAHSAGQMLSVGTPTGGAAGYVAMERVSGTLAGRDGTFALQHSGTFSAGAPTLSVMVVPGSGTGELAGLSGTMDIAISEGRHSYTLHYGLPR